jgi:deoxyribodipyrimidine photo-lyase
MTCREAHQIVWFKRDLRVEDNRALAGAAARGPVVPLYVVEPDLWAQPDMSARQWSFVAECLSELRARLAQLGQPLVIRTGDIDHVLEDLRADLPIGALWSHEETGNGWTYRRDRRVAAWCREAGIPWHEVQQHGVVRGLASRSGWAGKWDSFMAEPASPAPRLAPLHIAPGPVPAAGDLGLAPDPCPGRQSGGREAGLERLDSFLHSRGRSYRSAMSSPASGATACSRLSPHLAFGTLSMRRALKAATGPDTAGWRGAMRSFSGRLHWHCHFMQKLEDAPEIEVRNLHRAYDGLRPADPDPARLAAWQTGETGLPFLDACMRSLKATGWLNFRMRAMVMATASYHLWLDWRAPGEHLARMFTDYEPGIHWPQVQMQSGTTGINTVRVYNPVKQGKDQDPDGAFTRHWLPELAAIPDRYIHEPWRADGAGSVLGRAYPFPVVDHLAAAKEARQRIWAVRRSGRFRKEADAIQSRHGSRKSGVPNRGRGAGKADARQASLPLGDE